MLLLFAPDASTIHQTQLAEPHEGRRRVLRDPGNALRPEVADVRHPRPRPPALLAYLRHPGLGLHPCLWDSRLSDRRRLYLRLNPHPRVGSCGNGEFLRLARAHRALGVRWT